MMQREIVPIAAPPSKAVRRLVETMLGDGPIDPSVFAALADPAGAEARAKADAEQKALDWPNLEVKLVIDGKVELEHKGGLGAVDPVRPLAWMIDHAVRRRGGLRRGQGAVEAAF